MKVRIEGVAESGQTEFVVKNFETIKKAQEYASEGKVYCPWKDIHIEDVKRMKARVRLYSCKGGKKLATIERILDNEKVATQWAIALAQSIRAGYMILDSLPITIRPDQEEELVDRITTQKFEYEEPEE